MSAPRALSAVARARVGVRAWVAALALVGCNRVFPYEAATWQRDGRADAEAEDRSAVAADSSPRDARFDALPDGDARSGCLRTFETWICNEEATGCVAACPGHAISCTDLVCYCVEQGEQYFCQATGVECDACRAAFEEGCCGPRLDASTSQGACAFPATELSWKPDMAVCKLVGGMTTIQCDADQWCAPGWHPCTASEYLARGGAAESPPGDGTNWLAACVRQGDVVSAPTDSACDACSTATGDEVQVGWACAGDPLSSATTRYLAVGVGTNPSCFRLGADIASTEGRWTQVPAVGMVAGVMCCR